MNLPALVGASERFWRYVDQSGYDDCWNWKASKNNKGYGFFRSIPGIPQKSLLAHRVAYTLCKGDPSGMLVMHACDNPSCVNPSHLSLGTNTDNIRDASFKGRMMGRNSWAKQTHCKRGHLFDEANTYWQANNSRGSSRACRICKQYRRRWRRGLL